MKAKLGDVEHVAIDDLKPYPGNARVHNISAISESLAANGQYRPLVVQRKTSHVLAGNGTLSAARSLSWDTVAVQWIDVDDKTARRIVLADNRTSDLAAYDDDALAALLEATGGDLLGTGFSDTDVASVLDDAAGDGTSDSAPQLGDTSYAVIVDCDSEQQQFSLIERLEADGLKVRPLAF